MESEYNKALTILDQCAKEHRDQNNIRLKELNDLEEELQMMQSDLKFIKNQSNITEFLSGVDEIFDRTFNFINYDLELNLLKLKVESIQIKDLFKIEVDFNRKNNNKLKEIILKDSYWICLCGFNLNKVDIFKCSKCDLMRKVESFGKLISDSENCSEEDIKNFMSRKRREYDIYNELIKKKNSSNKNYILNAEWFFSWKAYISNDKSNKYIQMKKLNISNNKKIGVLPPLEIDNNCFFNINGSLIEDLKINEHYMVITKDLWDFFSLNYGGKPICIPEKSKSIYDLIKEENDDIKPHSPLLVPSSEKEDKKFKIMNNRPVTTCISFDYDEDSCLKQAPIYTVNEEDPLTKILNKGRSKTNKQNIVNKSKEKLANNDLPLFKDEKASNNNNGLVYDETDLFNLDNNSTIKKEKFIKKDNLGKIDIKKINNNYSNFNSIENLINMNTELKTTVNKNIKSSRTHIEEGAATTNRKEKNRSFIEPNKKKEEIYSQVSKNITVHSNPKDLSAKNNSSKKLTDLINPDLNSKNAFTKIKKEITSTSSNNIKEHLESYKYLIENNLIKNNPIKEDLELEKINSAFLETYKQEDFNKMINFSKKKENNFQLDESMLETKKLQYPLKNEYLNPEVFFSNLNKDKVAQAYDNNIFIKNIQNQQNSSHNENFMSETIKTVDGGINVVNNFVFNKNKFNFVEKNSSLNLPQKKEVLNKPNPRAMSRVDKPFNKGKNLQISSNLKVFFEEDDN